MMIKLEQRSEIVQILYSLRKEFLWVAYFSMIANLLMLSPTLYMMQVFDRVMISKSELTLMTLSAIILVFFFVMAFAEWLRAKLLVRVGVRLDLKMNSRLFNASFDAFLTQKITNAVEAYSDLTFVRQFITSTGIIACFDLPWTPIYIFALFLLHPYLAYLAIVFCLIQVCLAYLNHYQTGHLIKDASKLANLTNNYLQAKLRNIESVVAMGMGQHLRRRWLTLHNNAQLQHKVLHNSQIRQQSLNKFVRYSMQSLTLAAGALLVIRGELSMGTMIAANILVSRALQPIDQVAGSWKQFINALESYKRLEQLLTDFPERDGSQLKDKIAGDVETRKLTVTVSERQNPVLNDINLKLPAGQVVSVIGPSGSGKSTLTRCLVGIWSDFEGEVLLDGRSILSYDSNKLGPNIGYLPQDIELFEGTVADNISRFGKVDFNLVIEAAQMAGMHEIILRMPKGYDTPIGVSGASLSGGQRQRIGLARALYGNPALLVLDEPNANLDDVGELSLQQAIKTVKSNGQTVVIVTHRLNLLQISDQLLVLQDGKLLHAGPRDDVLNIMRAAKAESSKPVVANAS